MPLDNKTFRTAGAFILHLLIGTWGIVLVSAMLTFSLCSILHHWNPAFDSREASSLLTGVPGFPIQVSLGVMLGFLIGKWTRSKAILWTWILPLVVLAAVIVFGPSNGASAFAHYFGNGCRPADRCLDQLLFTLPCLAAAGYSLGAATAREIQDRRK